MARFPTRPWPIRNLQILHQTVPPESETTRLTIKLAAPQAAPLHADDPQLAMAFAERGMDLRETREVEDGLWLGFGELSIVLTTPPERPDEIRIIGTGEDDGAPRSPQARARFRACATLARFIAVRNRVRRIEWRHRGGHYITENGHIAVVSGMDGTTGRGPRRSAAARAFSLYGPASVDDDTARRSRQPISGSAVPPAGPCPRSSPRRPPTPRSACSARPRARR